MYAEPAAVGPDRPAHRGLQAAIAVAGMEVYVPGVLANVRSACAVMEKAERGSLVSWKVHAPEVFLAARRAWFPLPRRAARRLACARGSAARRLRSQVNVRIRRKRAPRVPSPTPAEEPPCGPPNSYIH